MSALICGSIAYDTIMVFHDHFKDHILPEKIHILNVSFLVQDLRKEFGGCAGNIAFNLKLLGGSGYIMGTVGKDFDAYSEWLDKNDIPQDHIKVIENAHTAQGFITTDFDNNQITAFHVGAMECSDQLKVTEAEDISIGIISPDAPASMIAHAEQFFDANIPFILDAGQNLLLFDGDSLDQFIDQANWVAVNDYEWQLLKERAGVDEISILERVEALIVTKGGEGSDIYTRNGQHNIPCAPVKKVVDPTGCGDAYRAGLLYGLMNGLNWETTGRIASLMGAIKIEQQGTQNHSFNRYEFKRRYQESFGSSANFFEADTLSAA